MKIADIAHLTEQTDLGCLALAADLLHQNHPKKPSSSLIQGSLQNCQIKVGGVDGLSKTEAVQLPSIKLLTAASSGIRQSPDLSFVSSDTSVISMQSPVDSDLTSRSPWNFSSKGGIMPMSSPYLSSRRSGLPITEHVDDSEYTKPKRKRANQSQLSALRAVYAETAFPSSEQRRVLAQQLKMTPRSVQIWFQNQRQMDRHAKKSSL